MSQPQQSGRARQEILARIRGALNDVPQDEETEQVPVTRHYRQQDDSSRAEILAVFIDRVTDYKATVHQVQESEVSTIIAEICKKYALRQLVAPMDMQSAWLPADASITVLRDEPQLTHEQLEESDAVLTGCALGIAQTGTIILDGGAMQGRRILSLLPDHALCVIRASQIVSLVPEAIRQLADAATVQQAPITFISGPSATSDIELNRVEGVHGPRKLDILLIP
jgi:L-lactate dehydrogenase complex protein LldG